MKLLWLCLLFSVSAQAQIDPCTCVWDGRTKDYPENSKVVSWSKTTVQYQCGYLCMTKNKDIQYVLGDHSASFRVEKGNEVVCDGLHYESQFNPDQKSDRWEIYVWDGIFHSFSANKSTSPTLAKWATSQRCNGASSNIQSVTTDQIDELRKTVGMPLLNQSTKANSVKLRQQQLDKKIRDICRQQGFTLIEQNCDVSSVEQKKIWQSTMTDVYHISNSSFDDSLINQIQQQLKCAWDSGNPSPVDLRMIVIKTYSLNHSLNVPEYKNLVCTMAERGLRWQMLPYPVQKMLSFTVSQ